MLMRLRWMSLLMGAVVIMSVPHHAAGQIPFESSTGQIPYAGQYNRGQDVVPSYDGWRPNPDGSFSMYFGYMNRNYEEQLDIDIGPENNVDGSDRGQPTHFYPRRHWFVFKVVVPKDWAVDKKVEWTLSIRGKTNIARGWLQPDWEINNEVMMENVGAGNRDLENEAPVITGSGPQTITLPNTVSLSAVAQDDLLPRPRGTNTQAQGLSVQWIQYRGPGPITFSPPTRVATSTPASRSVTSTTVATFKVPGAYVVRAVASDGALESFHDITVTVK